MTAVMHEFFAVLAKSELLSAETLDVARRQCESLGETAAIAKRLVGLGFLTPFHAKQIAAGRHRGFFLADKFKILDVLGEGGMGRVLLCEHLLLQRLVAVKLMQGGAFAKNHSAVDRFMREARAAASLNHPNIAQVFDVDQSERGPYIVMEFVDGVDLHRYTAKHGPIDWQRSALFTAHAAAGLQHAHSHSLVHRDIKPVNLMLDRLGNVKLLDLGLAKFFDAEKDDKLTQQHDVSAVIGTADFIAPEQVLDSSAADIRADIYSLGLTLYFLLARRMPLGSGKPIQKLVWHQTRHPEPIRKICPDVPGELAAILGRMIQKDPDERFQTPLEVHEALLPLAQGARAAPKAEELPRAWWIAYKLGLSGGRARARSLVESVSLSHVGSATASGSFELNLVAGDTQGARVPTSPSNPRLVSEELPAKSPTPPVATSVEVPNVPIPPKRIGRRTWLWTSAASSLGIAGAAVWIAKRGGKTPRAEAAPGEASDASLHTVPTTGVVLHGGGSTFVRPIMEHWAQIYQNRSPTRVEYTAVGSSKGIEGVTLKLLDFGCTDAYMTDEQLQAAGGKILHLPLVLGAVVPTYNVPPAGTNVALRFTGPLLANIFLGQITNWNDPAIAVNNPGVKLPDLPITVVYRKDGSGTSSIWTDYLSKASAVWKERVGSGTKVAWPTGIGAEKNDGVADAVSRNRGAIGYVELSFALANGLPSGQVKNAAGAFITPSIESVTAAAAGALDKIPGDFRFSLTDAPGPASYPIAGTAWAVLFVDQPSIKQVEMLDFLRWTVGEGQAYAGDLKYAPLPDELCALVQQALNDIDGRK
jgi:phosphate transport system substrate-binding protein